MPEPIKKEKIKYGVGDWIILKKGEEECLCVIAQVDSGKIACICIDDDANRMFKPISYGTSSYTDLSEDILSYITGKGLYEFRKVNVEIKVTETNE